MITHSNTHTAQNNMVGTFPPELDNLRYLKYLVVEQQPGISGSIPDSYGDLEHLNYGELVFQFLVYITYPTFSANESNVTLFNPLYVSNTRANFFDRKATPFICQVEKVGVLEFRGM